MGTWGYVIAAYAATAALYGGYLIYLLRQRAVLSAQVRQPISDD